MSVCGLNSQRYSDDRLKLFAVAFEFIEESSKMCDIMRIQIAINSCKNLQVDFEILFCSRADVFKTKS